MQHVCGQHVAAKIISEKSPIDKCGRKWEKVGRQEGQVGTKDTFELDELLDAGAFVGSHTHSLDGKKRLTIPSEWREAAGGLPLFVLKGVDQPCLYVFTARDMATKLDKIRAISVANAKAQQFLRSLFSSADRLEIDSAGRIRVSDRLLDFAGITGQVELVGVGGRFELWSPEQWNKQNSQLDPQSFAEAAASIGF
jgi:MraZ protein